MKSVPAVAESVDVIFRGDRIATPQKEMTSHSSSDNLPAISTSRTIKRKPSHSGEKDGDRGLPWTVDGGDIAPVLLYYRGQTTWSSEDNKRKGEKWSEEKR